MLRHWFSAEIRKLERDADREPRESRRLACVHLRGGSLIYRRLRSVIRTVRARCALSRRRTQCASPTPAHNPSEASERRHRLFDAWACQITCIMLLFSARPRTSALIPTHTVIVRATLRCILLYRTRHVCTSIYLRDHFTRIRRRPTDPPSEVHVMGYSDSFANSAEDTRESMHIAFIFLVFFLFYFIDGCFRTCGSHLYSSIYITMFIWRSCNNFHLLFRFILTLILIFILYVFFFLVSSVTHLLQHLCGTHELCKARSRSRFLEIT